MEILRKEKTKAGMFISDIKKAIKSSSALRKRMKKAKTAEERAKILLRHRKK